MKNWEQLVTDDIVATPRPSEDAIKIDMAHKYLRGALGTPLEDLARKYLENVVADVKARAK